MAGSDWGAFWLTEDEKIDSSVINILGKEFCFDRRSLTFDDRYVRMDNGEMWIGGYRISVESGEFASIAVIEYDYLIYIGVSYYKYLDLLTYIEKRDPDKIAMFPDWWDYEDTTVISSGGTLYFYLNDMNNTTKEVKVYENKPDMFVGFDREIKQEVFQMVSKNESLCWISDKFIKLMVG